jgi:hypothetical protein
MVKVAGKMHRIRRKKKDTRTDIYTPTIGNTSENKTDDAMVPEVSDLAKEQVNTNDVMWHCLACNVEQEGTSSGYMQIIKDRCPDRKVRLVLIENKTRCWLTVYRQQLLPAW